MNTQKNGCIGFQCGTKYRDANMSASGTLLVIFVLGNSLVKAEENEGVLAKIKSGLQYAKSYLDTAKEIADLVSQSLKHDNVNEKRGDDGDKRNTNPKVSPMPNLISGFFRLFGMDSPRITAIAINSFIFFAQMISSLFNVKPKPEEARSREEESPFDAMQFIVGNNDERIQTLLRQAQDPTLPDQLIERLIASDSSCAKLLMCKATPFILAAQNSLKNNSAGRRFDLTSWLPTKDTFEENSENCEEKYVNCELFPEST